ncbi:hypothetical protein GALMADRAFT_223419 [Galerina marginata CBS 339.88]|uniref:Uncharacterized protein n=1 Tax=Galerina marginata (strain CBS 339.88) TaxID=685588 RepID=A0A067TJM4_GALM3|nr:hypothetical protein GALMADRAFT_223419 [Galerina marginata CBS 339.88]
MATCDSLNPSSEVLFRVCVEDARSWFEVTLFEVSHSDDHLGGFVSVKGRDISRDEQERWQGVIAVNLKDLKESDTEFIFYQLLSICLLPLMHEDLDSQEAE